MRYYNNEFEDYDHYEVGQSMPLLEWMLANLKGSRSKLKATLQGRGVRLIISSSPACVSASASRSATTASRAVM